MSASAIQSLLGRLGRKAGIQERLAPHKLRHTWATLSLKHGGNLEYIRKMLGHSDIKTTSDAYLNTRDEDIQAAHRSFSPIANLGPTVNTENSLPELQSTADKDRVFKYRSNSSQPDEMDSVELRDQDAKSESASSRFTGPRAGTASESTNIKRHIEIIEPRLQPLFQDLYKEHLEKLVNLSKDLINDIKNVNTETRRKVTNINAKSPLGVKRVYKAQNAELWPFLVKHLDNEFNSVSFEKLVSEMANAAFWSQAMKKELTDASIVQKVKELLLVVKERGTLLGKCKICESYFFRDGNNNSD